MKLAQASADQGNAEGLAVLGLLTVQGRGLPADAVAGAALIRQAAERGNRMAQYSMATLNFRGLGLPNDWIEELAWLRLFHFDIGRDDRGDPLPEDWGDLMIEAWPRTTQIGNYYRNSAAGDLEAITRAAAWRKAWADDGRWPH